jgi:hypothetical protein
MVYFRIYHQHKDAHVHMRVFCGEQDSSVFDKCGELVMPEPAFFSFRSWLRPRVQFFDEGELR